MNGRTGSSRRRAARAAEPRIGSPHIEADLDAIVADNETRAFALSLRDTGVAPIAFGDEIEALCDAVVADTDPYFDGPPLSRVQDAWRRSAAVRALAGHPKVLRLLAAAYGREPFPFQTLNFKQGSRQKPHADSMHFHSEPRGFMCGVWFALEDVRPEAGPLFYHPGSHRERFGMAEAGAPDRPRREEDYEAYYAPALARRLEGTEKRLAMLRKGEALVWAADLVHGGEPIEDAAATRRSLVVHYFFEDCLYNTPMLSRAERDEFVLRLPPDVRTGALVWPRRAGRLHAPRLRHVAAAWRDRLGRKIHRIP